MKLRRLAVRNFRKLEQQVEIGAIGDGLTLITGDNEEGKSTLLVALKAALFEHHLVGGTVRERMAPRASGLVPEIELDFEVNGKPWRLRKAFRRGGCELAGDGARLSGDAAEDRLLALLRFQRRQGRAEARPEHHGLAALLWLDQGTSFAGFAPLAASRDRIAAAVADEVGRVTAGAAGARLAAAVRVRCDRWWTEKFQPRGSIRELDERCGALRGAARELRQRLADAHEKEQRLARLRDQAVRQADGAAPERGQQRRREGRRVVGRGARRAPR